MVDQGYALTPWVSGSIGVGFNYSHKYNNTPIVREAAANANFSSRTYSAFSYTLGIGIQKILNQNWQIGIGYEFTDWGKSQLDRASEQTLNSGLSLRHLYTNGSLLNVTYLV